MTLDALSASFSGAWVTGVRAGGTFVRNSKATWELPTSGSRNAIPSEAGLWTIEDADE